MRARHSSLEGMAGPFSFLAGAVLASLADLLADGPAPSWLVRVGPFLGDHFPARNLSLRPGRPGLLLEELGRCLLAFFPGRGAKETHGAMVDRRLAHSAPFAAVRGDPGAAGGADDSHCADHDARCRLVHVWSAEDGRGLDSRLAGGQLGSSSPDARCVK
jgi:hypothetical protein